MQKREAKFGILFRHWLRANPMHTASFELKQTTTDSLSFSAVEDHQADYANAIENGEKGVLIRVQGTNGEPDYVLLRDVPAYIAIRYPDSFHIIHMRTFMAEKSVSDKKSLSSKRARALAVRSVDI